MRFVERVAGRVGSVAVLATLAACSTFGGKAADSTAPEAAASTNAKPAATAKDSAAPAPSVQPQLKPVSPAVQRAFDDALKALAAGRITDAERGFTALTKSNPELAGPHANLGLIHRQAGRTAEAVAALEKAVQLNPQRADLHNQLGIAYRFAGDFTKAKVSYEQAIALDPAYASAVLNLGILYDLYLWDGARALELYDRYLQLAGGDEQVKRWISDLRNRGAQKSAAQRKEQG